MQLALGRDAQSPSALREEDEEDAGFIWLSAERLMDAGVVTFVRFELSGRTRIWPKTEPLLLNTVSYESLGGCAAETWIRNCMPSRRNNRRVARQ